LFYQLKSGENGASVVDKQLKAALFDLDGTLVDSEPNYHQADTLFLANHGITLSPECWLGIPGMGSATFIQLMMDEYGLRGQLPELLAEKNRIYLEIGSKHTAAFPEMLLFLQACREAGLRTAIASGSSPQIIRDTLQWAGIAADSFELLLSAEEVAAGKPAPDVFLEAAARLGCAPEHCLVLEDSRAGVLAAAAAGMDCVAIPGLPLTGEDPVYSKARFLYPQSMPGFSCADLLQRLKSTGLWPVG